MDVTHYSAGASAESNRPCLVFTVPDSKVRAVICGEVYTEHNSYRYFQPALEKIIEFYKTAGVNMSPDVVFIDACPQGQDPHATVICVSVPPLPRCFPCHGVRFRVMGTKAGVRRCTHSGIVFVAFR